MFNIRILALVVAVISAASQASAARQCNFSRTGYTLTVGNYPPSFIKCPEGMHCGIMMGGTPGCKAGPPTPPTPPPSPPPPSRGRSSKAKPRIAIRRRAVNLDDIISY